ncbi:MAG TPA: SDR family oxidoreductase, partial [Nitrospiria bacterium]
EFLSRPGAARHTQIGPFTPDHLMHIKPWPLFLDSGRRPDPDKIRAAVPAAVERYRNRYADYFERHKTPGVTMLDPNPRVILIPGVGMFTAGKDRRAGRIAQDLYRHTLAVIQSSTALSSYVSLTPRELCDFEYWPMENFKLTLLPPEKELSRRIALVTGAAGAIGRAMARRLAAEGAMVVLTDINLEKTRAIAEAINEQAGEENALALKLDVANEASVRRAFDAAARTFGGLDLLVSNAGIARSAPVERLSLADWEASLAVNATGHFLVCREAMRIFKEQGLGGNIVVVSTKNVPAPGKDFGAYSASKAVQAQLSRILAIEGAEDKIRVNLINPDGIFEGSGLWSKEIREERAGAHGIPIETLENFYAGRNLLKTRITAADVAEAVLFFASDRSAKTTGAMLPVDGGLREAFPR